MGWSVHYIYMVAMSLWVVYHICELFSMSVLATSGFQLSGLYCQSKLSCELGQLLTMMLMPVLVLLCAYGAQSTGAYTQIFVFDWQCYEAVPYAQLPGCGLFHMQDQVLGPNPYTLVCSHASQWWYEVYALWGPITVGRRKPDVSTIFNKTSFLYRRELVFLGHLSFVCIMGVLWTSLLEEKLPWMELCCQGNNYAGEEGCRITIRHHCEPMLWLVQRTINRTIDNHLNLYRTFHRLTIPKLFVDGNLWNWAAYLGYVSPRCPKLPIYCPPEGCELFQALEQQYQEELGIYQHKDTRHYVGGDVFQHMRAVYRHPYEEGLYLTQAERTVYNIRRQASL